MNRVQKYRQVDSCNSGQSRNSHANQHRWCCRRVALLASVNGRALRCRFGTSASASTQLISTSKKGGGALVLKPNDPKVLLFGHRIPTPPWMSLVPRAQSSCALCPNCGYGGRAPLTRGARRPIGMLFWAHQRATHSCSLFLAR